MRSTPGPTATLRTILDPSVADPLAERISQLTMTSNDALGWLFLVIGFVMVLPITGSFFRWWGEFQLRALPWLKRLPGSAFYQHYKLQNRLRVALGLLIALVGILALSNIVELT